LLGSLESARATWRRSRRGRSSRLLRLGRPGPARTNRGHCWATAAP